MNPCPNAASWNDGDGEADRPIPTPKRGLSGPANSGGQGQVELGRASGLVVGGLGIAEAEVFEDFPRGQAVLDDGNDLIASSALSALEDVDVEDALEQGCPVEAVGSVLASLPPRGVPLGAPVCSSSGAAHPPKGRWCGPRRSACRELGADAERRDDLRVRRLTRGLTGAPKKRALWFWLLAG